jgi:hypothetical protein
VLNSPLLASPPELGRRVSLFRLLVGRTPAGIAAAEEASDPQTKHVCEGILATQQQLGNRLLPYLPQVTREYMRRDAADVAAKR